MRNFLIHLSEAVGLGATIAAVWIGIACAKYQINPFRVPLLGVSETVLVLCGSSSYALAGWLKRKTDDKDFKSDDSTE